MNKGTFELGRHEFYPNEEQLDFMEIITPRSERWEEFAERLEGKEGCNFRFDDDNEAVWECHHDTRFAAALLTTFENVDVIESLTLFKEYGGNCDCEILFNVEARYQNKDSFTIADVKTRMN